MSAQIELDAVRKTFPAPGGETVAVDNLSLTVRPGEVLALVGPSGCGKSTTLRMINRLVEPTSGRIVLDGVDTATLDPVKLRRGIGYVIQDVGLLPHRTVEANVATVPRLLGWDRARTRARAAEVLELVGLPVGTYGRRYPHQLSGGERQRVGVARALATDPGVLLLDEPFGAVDPEFRRKLQAELAGILQQVGSTVILVTHDLDEAVRLADRVAVLSRGGHLEQVAPPLAVLAHPATAKVRDFVGDGAALRMLSLTHIEARDLRPDDGGGAEVSTSDSASSSAPGPATGTPQGTSASASASAPGATSVTSQGSAADGAASAVRLGAPLAEAFAALAASGAAVVRVTDDAGKMAGVLDADGMLAALRRAADAAGERPATLPA